VVYPLIEESEALDFKNLTEGYEYITASFPLPKYKAPANKIMKAKTEIISFLSILLSPFLECF